MNLKSQVFDCFPAKQYGLVKLLRLVDVVETDAVPSAAVECSGAPRLLINPEFVRIHANTPEKLFVLVLHELYHVILGHTGQIKPITALDNFVFDCVINALICRQFPSRRYTSLFTEFYRADVFPTCFLRPPENWKPDQPAQLPAVLKGGFKEAEQARRIYNCLYSEEGATYSQLYSLFPKLILKLSKPGSGLNRRKVVQVEDIKLLGGHGEQSAGLQSTFAEQIVHSTLSEFAHNWPSQPEPIRGKTMASFLKKKTIEVVATTQNKALLHRLISSVAAHGDVWSDSLRTGQSLVQYQTPIRPLAVARRDVVQQALGFKPLLFQGETWGNTRQYGNEPVHVYLDVSGSVDGLLNALYGAVLSAGELVYPAIHLFSTEVNDIGFSQLRAGKVVTTGGTSIDCVVRHMAANKVRNALLVTDGCVGRLKDTQLKLLSNVRLAVAYTPSHNKDSLSKVASYTGVLSTSRQVAEGVAA